MQPEHWLYTIPLRMRSLFRWAQADKELDDELRDHLERKTEEYVATGMAPEEARRLARLELGGMERVKEQCRDRRRINWFQDSAHDIRYGLRMLRRTPGFSAVAVLTLALGIGANTAIFSVINSVLLEPLPFKNPAQLVSLRETESAPGDFPLDGADYLDWQAQNRTFSSMSLYTQAFFASAVSYSTGDEDVPEAVAAIGTEANFFETLGIQPLIGRTFAEGEDAAGKDHEVILSYGFWRRHFAESRDALGKTIHLNGEAYTIIGAMPPAFNFPPTTDMWIPLDMTQPLVHNRGSHWAQAVGRVKDGVTVEQARADLLTVSARVNKQYRAPNDQDIHSLVYPLKDRLVGNSHGQLLILFGAVALVLLVACANVANLLLARSTARVREMAMRAALGAGRWRLARQMLTESILLALGGAALGILAASWGVSLLQTAKTSPIPRVNPVHVNSTVLLFALGVSVFVGILFGLAPALRCSDLDLSEELKSSANAISATGSGRVLRNTLIVAEIAVSLALLVGAGLLLRSFARLRSADLGVDPHNVLTMRVNVPDTKYKTVAAQRQFLEQLLSLARRIPGVSTAALSTETAVDGGSNGYVTVPGNTTPKLQNQLVEVNNITPDYFKTFGIPVIKGRTFNEEDMQRAADLNQQIIYLMRAAKKDSGNMNMPPGLSFPVIINEAMAKAYWPNQDPIGKSYTGLAGDRLQRIVIGVVGDERQFNIREAAIPENYVPLTLQLGDLGIRATISLKTQVAPATVLTPARGVVRDLDGTMAVYHVRTMEDIIAEGMQDTTLQTFLLASFAALALVLAAVGLYGVMSYLVTQRTHEIGIRMALGAQRGEVLRTVIFQGARLITIGVAIGIAAALALMQLLAASLFGVTATDATTYASVSALLAIVALLACYVPARRAIRVDPMVALRYE